MSSKLIASLNEAERKAESIIEDAKKYRKTILAKAKDAAEEELKGFSENQDIQLREALAVQGDDDATKALAAVTASELAAVEGDFVKNSVQTVEYVVQKVLDVPLTLTSTQRQALIAESSKPAAPAKQPAAPKPAAPKPAAAAPPPQREAAPAPAPVPEPVAAAPPPVVQAAPQPTPTVAAAPAPAQEEEADEAEAEPAPAPAAPAQIKPESKKKNKKKTDKAGE